MIMEEYFASSPVLAIANAETLKMTRLIPLIKLHHHTLSGRPTNGMRHHSSTLSVLTREHMWRMLETKLRVERAEG
jgi:hypothetical protein